MSQAMQHPTVPAATDSSVSTTTLVAFFRDFLGDGTPNGCAGFEVVRLATPEEYAELKRLCWIDPRLEALWGEGKYYVLVEGAIPLIHAESMPVWAAEKAAHDWLALHPADPLGGDIFQLREPVEYRIAPEMSLDLAS